MMMDLKPGLRLRSRVSGTEIIVVRAPKEPVEVACAGEAMVEVSASGLDVFEPGNDTDDRTQLGKRYTSEHYGLEVLCTKAGGGPLAVNGDVMTTKESKPLPSSD